MPPDDLPPENTCWAMKGYGPGPSTHAVVTGTVLRRMQLRVTYRWRSGEPGSATLEDFHHVFERCTYAHPKGGAHG